MNKTLKFLIISDILIIGAFGLITPIFSIFIEGGLEGGSIFAAGVASSIWFLTHSTLQILFAYKFKPKDRLWMLWLGTAIIVLVPFAYIFITHVYHLYLIEFLYAVGAALSYPAWSSLFTAHLESGKRGFQYSLHSSGYSFAAAITAIVGGWLAENVKFDIGTLHINGFQIVFAMTGVISLVGLIFLFKIQKSALKKT